MTSDENQKHNDNSSLVPQGCHVCMPGTHTAVSAMEAQPWIVICQQLSYMDMLGLITCTVSLRIASSLTSDFS